MDEVIETRASRRGRPAREPEAMGPAEGVEPSFQLIRTLTVAAVAGLVVLAAHAHPTLLAALMAWSGAGLAWGWGAVTNLATGWRTGAVVAGTGMLVAAATAFVDDAPYLRLVPVALAVGLVAIFLLQLLRKDGRAELTDEVVATCGGIGILASGAVMVPLARIDTGPAVATTVMAGVAAALLTDLLVGRAPLHAWLVPIAMVLGGTAGVVVALALGPLSWGAGLLFGMLAGAVSYAVRRLVEGQPRGGEVPAQVAAAIASVLFVGVLAMVAALLFA